MTSPFTLMRRVPRTRPAATVLAGMALAGMALAAASVLPAQPLFAQTSARHAVIPAPTSVEIAARGRFTLNSNTAVVIDSDASAEIVSIGRRLASMLGSGAVREPRRMARAKATPNNAIRLTIDPRLADTGAEGYTLEVRGNTARLAAREAAGLFYAVQTLRQLMPVSIEHRAAIRRGLSLPVGKITDTPRYSWRGSMLDVARHFLPPADVKRHIDIMALYKLNVLHLHLSDDQGWRIEIKSRPNLTRIGGRSEVGGGEGGYYTQAEYKDLVAYAQARYVTIVPEIDMPGHTNAALVSYPELNCAENLVDGKRPQPYTGTRVGFSVLCHTKESTYTFVEDVVRELAAMTPGPYIHLGGDEVEKLTHTQYLRFIERIEGIVRANGKEMIGWGEIAPAKLNTRTLVQHWRSDAVASRDSAWLHAERGGSIIMSPGNRTYLDMKYDSTTTIGLTWAGMISVEHAYSWEPSTFLKKVPASSVIGVEAPLWGETVEKLSDYQYLAFPRLIAIAELGWSQPSNRGWPGFRNRLAQHGPRLQALGVNFYRSPEIPWVVSGGR